MPLVSSHDCTSGTSRRQCGHQCARNITTFGAPSSVIDTEAPAKSCPVSSGGASPTAGSGELPSYGTSAEPPTLTVPSSVLPDEITVPGGPWSCSLTTYASPSVESRLMTMATTSATPISRTTTAAMASMRLLG